MDPMCGKLHTNVPTEADYRVGEANGLADVFVYVQGVPEGIGATPEGEAPLLDQQGCLYTPKVFGVLVNQKFKIRNSDALLHNVHAVPKTNSEFNFAQPIKGQVNEKAFPKPEVLLRIKCDVHPWMNTFVGVVPHKFFAVTDENGRFRLPGGLPAGKYTIEAVHPKAGRIAQEITVTAGENKPVVLTLSAK
ncbi:MAG: carboxypeptidase regulatory-like domain-containing protein [Gammaproteobacteria bacterium]